MEKQVKEVVLEPSTNTHKLNGNIISKTELGEGILKINVHGDGIVTHGEHGTLKTESPVIMKYTQKEYNPVTKAMQNAFD